MAPRSQLPYKELPGVVSALALEEHRLLFEGYEERADEPDASPHDVAGALLHDLFFRQLAPNPQGARAPRFEAAIAKRWGAIEAWWSEMRLVAEEARGWAITAIRGDDLRILRLDAHAEGGVVGYEPLVLIDCYEHAYWMDYGSRKMAYVDALYHALDWVEVDRRFALRACGEAEKPDLVVLGNSRYVKTP